jgi:hypothetical protein
MEHPGSSSSGAAWFPDPLDPDEFDDVPVLTTRRALSRVALVASETATRFALDGILHEPMVWMMAPRRLFGGVSALEACLHLDACESAIALHRVGETLDAEPSGFDGDEDAKDLSEVGAEIAGADHEDAEPPRTCPSGRSGTRPTLKVCGGRPDRAAEGRLFSAVVHDRAEGGFVQAFAAMVTTSRASFRSALGRMYGEAAAGATVMEGFDSSHPLVAALVSPAIADVSQQPSRRPPPPERRPATAPTPACVGRPPSGSSSSRLGRRGRRR